MPAVGGGGSKVTALLALDRAPSSIFTRAIRGVFDASPFKV